MAERGEILEVEEDLYNVPRCFKFQLLCLNCDYDTNNLKDLKVHLKKQCPYRSSVPCNLLCGHCEYRTVVFVFTYGIKNQSICNVCVCRFTFYLVVIFGLICFSARVPCILDFVSRPRRHSSATVIPLHFGLDSLIACTLSKTRTFDRGNVLFQAWPLYLCAIVLVTPCFW